MYVRHLELLVLNCFYVKPQTTYTDTTCLYIIGCVGVFAALQKGGGGKYTKENRINNVFTYSPISIFSICSQRSYNVKYTWSYFVYVVSDCSAGADQAAKNDICGGPTKGFCVDSKTSKAACACFDAYEGPLCQSEWPFPCVRRREREFFTTDLQWLFLQSNTVKWLNFPPDFSSSRHSFHWFQQQQQQLHKERPDGPRPGVRGGLFSEQPGEPPEPSLRPDGPVPAVRDGQPQQCGVLRRPTGRLSRRNAGYRKCHASSHSYSK